MTLIVINLRILLGFFLQLFYGVKIGLFNRRKSFDLILSAFFLGFFHGLLVAY